MAKAPYVWNKVSTGDIISFMYKTKKGENLSRTVLVLEPNINNLIHGLQLEISNVPTNIEIPRILKLAGKTEIVDEGKEIYRVDIDMNTASLYTKMKGIINKHKLYRTYSIAKAKSSLVYLDDLKLPIDFVKGLTK
jgi:hypothetical protein|tara:strand:+ start:1383 stop:1790 length:408 start_codon:yes stop_codon:yes gene_type:complete